MTNDEFDAILEAEPESKLELIDGKVIVGNDLTGTKLLLRTIIEGWGTMHILKLVDQKSFIEAMEAVYLTMPFTTIIKKQRNNTLKNVPFNEFKLENLNAGRKGKECGHWQTVRLFKEQLYRAASLSECGQAIGSDFIMRLNDNCFTPDMLLIRGEPLNHLCNWYCDGPADLVIEVVLPGHRNQDYVVKKEFYRSGGVPEYWIADPENKEMTFLRLINGEYKRRQPDENGRYQPHNIAGLTLLTEKIWESRDYQDTLNLSLFEVRRSDPPIHLSTYMVECIEYGSISVSSRIELKSSPVTFEEFVSCAPRAKFEYLENAKISIGYHEEFIGLLIRSLGMIETVKLAHPAEWLRAYAYSTLRR